MAFHIQHAVLRLSASRFLPSTRPPHIANHHPALLALMIHTREIGTTVPNEYEATSLPEAPQGIIDVPALQFPTVAERTSAPVEISKPELQHFIYPLLCHAWQLNTDSTRGLFLTRRMVFKGPMSARKFLKELFDVEESLSHHSTSLHLDGEKRPGLTITTHTHDLERPWLSLRDVALAGTLESIYRESAYGPTKGKSAVQPPYLFDVASWEKLLSQYPWDLERLRIEDNKIVML